MPLTVSEQGTEQRILKVGGNEKTRNHLENLGFVPGGYATVISENGGNLIIKVKDARIALDKSLAMKIMV